MRNIAVASLIFAVNLNCIAQKINEAEVPSSVKQAFSNAYPKTKVSKWEREKGNYEAEFKNNKIETSVLIDPVGVILETEVEISIKELPAAAKEYISKQFASEKIVESAKITATDGSVTYEAEVAKRDLIFDAAGKYIKTEPEDGDDKED